jgi:hypothetical protein
VAVVELVDDAVVVEVVEDNMDVGGIVEDCMVDKVAGTMVDSMVKVLGA